MTNQQLLVPSVVGGAMAPPINVDALDSKELRELCKGMFTDLSFLAGVVPGNVGALASTAMTAAAAMTAGAIDGYLEDKANIGPVSLSAAVATGMAVIAMVTKDPDAREGAAAVARGFGAPILYEWSRRKVTTWKQSPKSGTKSDG